MLGDPWLGRVSLTMLSVYESVPRFLPFIMSTVITVIREAHTTPAPTVLHTTFLFVAANCPLKPFFTMYESVPTIAVIDSPAF